MNLCMSRGWPRGVWGVNGSLKQGVRSVLGNHKTFQLWNVEGTVVHVLQDACKAIHQT